MIEVAEEKAETSVKMGVLEAAIRTQYFRNRS